MSRDLRFADLGKTWRRLAELTRGHEVGEVTSGTVSPTLARPVMLAYVTAATVRDQGLGELHAVVRDKRPSVHVTPLPFVAKRYKR